MRQQPIYRHSPFRHTNGQSLCPPYRHSVAGPRPRSVNTRCLCLANMRHHRQLQLRSILRTELRSSSGISERNILEKTLHPKPTENAASDPDAVVVRRRRIGRRPMQHVVSADAPRCLSPSKYLFSTSFFVPFDGISYYPHTFLTPPSKTRPCISLILTAHSI